MPLLQQYQVVSVDSTFQFPKALSLDEKIRTMAANGGRLPDSTHPKTASFVVEAFGRKIDVSLDKNTRIFAPHYQEIHQWYDAGVLTRSEVVRTGMSEESNCYYQGKVKSHEGFQIVAFHTCNGGYTGVIATGDDDVLNIAPAHLHLSAQQLRDHHMTTAASKPLSSLHIVYREKDVSNQPEFSCFVGKEDSHSHTHDHSHTPTSTKDMVELLKQTHSRSQTQAAPSASSSSAPRTDSSHFSTSGNVTYGSIKQKTVELLLVNDKALFDQYTENTEIHTAALLNIADSFYNAGAFSPTAGLWLVGQITFVSGDPFNPAIVRGSSAGCTDCAANEVDVRVLLPRFHQWRSNVLNVPLHHDNGHLMSGEDFNGPTLGYAGVSAMCNYPQSGGINMANNQQLDPLSGAILAHELGHNFGMSHDSQGNACPQTGFIMNAAANTRQPPSRFSACSLTYYAAFMATNPDCLDNAPTQQWGDPECGNNFVEEGEQCDCGRSDCRNSTDPCCDGTTCRLHDWAHCSTRDGCCSPVCEIYSAGARITCRPAAGVCDIPEVCPGGTSKCPVDATIGAGRSCTDATFGDGVCYRGDCTSLNKQCSQIGRSIPGGPWRGSGDHKECNAGQYCNILYCSSDAYPSCTIFTSAGLQTRVPDGVPCDDNMQCSSNRCVDDFNLNNLASFVADPWQPCSECGSDQFRTASCIYVSTGATVPEQACSVSGRPPLVQLCRNNTLGCVYRDDVTGTDVALFGYVIARNTLMFGVLGFIALVLVTIACCYQGVTYGGEPKHAEEDEEEFEGEEDFVADESGGHYARKSVSGPQRRSSAR